MINSNRFQLTLYIFLLCASSLYSQRYEATLSSVDTSGFYKVEIPLEVMKEVEEVYEFFLANEKGERMSYILRRLDSWAYDQMFSYKSTISHTEHSTQMVIETDKLPIDHFYVEIRNSHGLKKGFILGSDDSKKWFNVKDEIVFEAKSNIHTTVCLRIYFPKSNYRFYKVVINDSTSAALNFVGANYVVKDTAEICSTIEAKIEDIKYDKSNSDTTKLAMLLPENVRVNDINIYVSTPRFFNREVHMYRSKKPIEVLQKASGRRKKRETVTRKPQYVSYNLKSSDSHISALHIGDKCDSIYIDIINGGNAPLSIDSLTFTVFRYELIAYLEGKSDYTLSYGGVPDGDWMNDLSFSAYLPKTIQQLEITSISELPQIEKPKDKEKSALKIFIEEYGILIVISIAILVILYVSYNLVKDKKEE